MTIPFTISARRTTFARVATGLCALLALTGIDAHAEPANPPPPKATFKPARPIGHPGEWASDNDYPTRALQLNESGIAGFALTLDRTGTPTACEITRTSNSAELDQTTCDLMIKRARFEPATDASGHPIASTYRSSVRWQIPPQENSPIPPSGKTMIAFDILPDGTQANCTQTREGGLSDPAFKVDLCAQRSHFVVPLNPAGQPVKKHVVFETSVTTTDVP